MGVAGKRLTQQTLIVQSQKQSQSQMQSQTLGDQPEVTLAVEPPDKRQFEYIDLNIAYSATVL